MYALFPSVLVAIAQIALLGLTSAGTDHFVMKQCQSISVSRIDPIVDSGGVAKHVHNICGGSSFGPTLASPDAQSGGSCSSAIIGDDKSNYWAPQLYWQYPNGTYQPMIGNQRIYYFMKGDVKPFPPGLHMISGDSMIRNATSHKSLGVMLSCNHGDQSAELPQKSCGAISLGIFFPSCGLANGAISSEDNFSHMTWPIKYLGGAMADTPIIEPNGQLCPDSHPIKYPTIFYESNYYPTGGQNWEEGTKLVLSNGDEWGPSFHADFHNGWVPSVLADTIKQAGGVGRGPGEHPEKVAALRPSVSQENSEACRYEGKIPNEDVGFFRAIDSLPGCNPPWPEDVVTKPGCETPPPVPEFVYPNVYFRSLLVSALLNSLVPRTDVQRRTNIPTVFTEATEDVATNAEELKKDFAPALGDSGQSFYVPWGIDGSNKDKLRVSSVLDLLSGGSGGDSNSGNTGGDQNSGGLEIPDAPVPAASQVESSSAAVSATLVDSASSLANATASSTGVASGNATASSASAGPSPIASAIASHVISSASAVSAGVSTTESAVSMMPTAGHAAIPGGTTCQKHRPSRGGAASHLGRRSRRAALGLQTTFHRTNAHQA